MAEPINRGLDGEIANTARTALSQTITLTGVRNVDNFSGDYDTVWFNGGTFRGGADRITLVGPDPNTDGVTNAVYGDARNVGTGTTMTFIGGGDTLDASRADFGNVGFMSGDIYQIKGAMNVTFWGGDDWLTGTNLPTGAAREWLIGDAWEIDMRGAAAATSATGGKDTIHGLGGDDYIVGDMRQIGLVNTLKGGDDVIDGGAGDDLITGDFGDVLNFTTAAFGNDLILGGDGNDTIYGDYWSAPISPTGTNYSGGNDTIYGGAGNDRILLGPGADYADGGTGDDEIVGSIADWDTVGFNTVAAAVRVDLAAQTATGQGTDKLLNITNVVGSALGDQIYGDARANWIWGNLGDDVIDGREGNDVLNGEDGNDTLVGALGNDQLFGGAGQDVAYGGVGDDLVGGGAGDDSLFGDAGHDQLYGDDGADFLAGGVGDDVLVGGEGADTLWGGEGRDYLVAGEGGGVLDGNGGNDSLWGGWGGDTMVGGDGADLLVGYGGTDFLFGGFGDDAFYGGQGSDYIWTNAGSDFVWTDDIGAPRSTDYVYVGGGTGADTIADFTPGNGWDRDVLVVSSASGVTSYAQAMANATQIGVYTKIALGSDEVWLYNVQPWQLTANDFIFI